MCFFFLSWCYGYYKNLVVATGSKQMDLLLMGSQTSEWLRAIVRRNAVFYFICLFLCCNVSVISRMFIFTIVLPVPVDCYVAAESSVFRSCERLVKT